MVLVFVALLMMSALVAAATGLASVIRRRRVAERRALEDRLTGIGNRLALFGSGTALLRTARRADRPAALLLIALDAVEVIEERHGHDALQALLVAFARLAHDYLPPTSLVCRIGEAKFAAILPGAEPARASAIADEIRALFAHLTIDGPSGKLRTTVSIGVVHYDGMTEPVMADLLDRAGRCLSAARRSGGDRVMTEQAVAPATPPVGASPIAQAADRWSMA